MNWLADSKPGEEAETKTLLVALLVCVCVQQLRTRARQITTRQLAAVYLT